VKVIKLGGSLLDDKARRDAVLGGIARLWKRGEQLAIVHGGGKHIDAALANAGIAKKTHAGLRITDDATLEIVVDVLDHVVNPLIVSELRALGINAAGVSGASVLIAEKHPAIDGVDLLNVGRVTQADGTLACDLLHDGALPVISCIASSSNGAHLNVNADSAASAVAVAMRASSLEFITDVAGLLDENGEVVPSLDIEATQEWISNVSGGMKPKLQAALHALQNGVNQIAIGEKGGTNLVAA